MPSLEFGGAPRRLILSRCAAVAVLLALVVILALAGASSEQADDLSKLSGKALTEEKARAEIRKLRRADGTDWTVITALVTAGAAAAGVLLTLWKQITESAEQRRADREARADAAEHRFDEQFNGFIHDLGAEQTATRVGAAVGLIRFLDPRYSAYHADVTRLLIAHLKAQSDPTTIAVLRDGLERAFRLGPIAPDDRNLAGALLDHAKFSDLELDGLDITRAHATFADFSGAALHRMVAREADIEKATFSRATLQEARFRGANCEGTDFSQARLVSAHFKEANLKNTSFRGAALQGALFRGANLSGTRFEQADLADAHFNGAAIAPETYFSITRAFNWRRAHFDEADRENLEQRVGELS